MARALRRLNVFAALLTLIAGDMPARHRALLALPSSQKAHLERSAAGVGPRRDRSGTRGEEQAPEIRLSPRAKVAAIVAVLALVLLVLVAARDVLAPFAWAFVAAYVVHPSVAWLVRRTGLPRLAILGALYVALLTLFAF